MSSKQLADERIFHVARGIAEVELRAEYLDQICAGDQNLRSRVEALLKAHENEQEFLKSEPAPTLDQPTITEGPGTQIGRYKLLQQIGEGGFGVVYMAEQHRPVRRKVALKIIKPGMDTHAVVARFEAERQALAMMDHPNISRVLDGGATESGRPYFVMELVRGVPITEYCDKNNLPTQERLELFMTVCQAVQHAHQKGIIHRDLKPSNILVTLADEKPVVKVIDFGVSKALNQQLTDKTLFTTYGQMIGTPQYMSPEQAEMSCLDVDTRSDVYSLGVLLYELLTGTTPLEGERLRTAGYAEMLRMIREDEPPMPSTRLTSVGEELTIIAKNRGVAPDRLQRTIRGDMDWIVMKGLEKDRTRRYESPSSFADDVRRFLIDEPIEARSPSTWYRLNKYVARNRRSAAAVGTIATLITLGAVFATVGFLLYRSLAAERAEKVEELEAAQQSLKNVLLEFAFDSAMRGDPARSEELIKRAGVEESDPDRARVIRALVTLYAGDPQASIDQLTNHGNSKPTSVSATAVLTTAYLYTGEADRRRAAQIELLAGTPTDDYDLLLRAHALVWDDPKSAVAALRELDGRHGTWGLTKIMLAHAMATRAMDADDLGLARESMDLLATNSRNFTDHPYAIAVRLFANHVAIRIGRRHVVDTSAWEATATATAMELEQFEGFSLGFVVLAAYYDFLGDFEKAESMWRNSMSGSSSLWRRYRQAFLFKHHKSKEAIALGQAALCPRLFTDLPDGRERALAAYEDAVQNDGSTMTRIWCQFILVLAGEKERAIEEWKRLASTANTGLRHLDWPIKLYSGEMEPAELLTHAKSLDSLTALSQAHFYVAYYWLLHDDRQKAEHHFQRVCDLDVFTGDVLNWSKGVISRMQNDPNWPQLPSEEESGD